MVDEDSTKVPLRTLLIFFLNSQMRESMLSCLTPDETRVVIYQYSTVPALGRIDPNQIPEPPLADADMNRLLISAQRKIELWLTQPSEETA